MSFDLDYDLWIHLDAENLAETGIAEAYSSLIPELPNGSLCQFRAEAACRTRPQASAVAAPFVSAPPQFG